jgi:hypothetical protein
VLENLYSCDVKDYCDPLDCSNTEPEVCQIEMDLVGACASSTCLDCLNSAVDAIGDSFSCVDFTIGMCPAIATECDCGTCRQLIEDVSASYSSTIYWFILLILQIGVCNEI